MLAIEVLMQAVIVAFLVLQQQRRWPELACLVAALQKCLMAFGIADVDPHRLIPAVSDGLKARIEQRAQFSNRLRQWVGEIFVFAATKSVAAHHNAAAKDLVLGIEFSQRAALVGREQSL